MSTNKASIWHGIALYALATATTLGIGSFVSVPQAGAQASVQTADNNNIFANSMGLTTLSTDVNTLYFVTSNFDPANFGDTFEDHALGVFFDWGHGYWAVFNQDGAAMPVGAAFNVVGIPPAFTGGTNNAWVHTAATDNDGDYTVVENTSQMANALVWVTPNWNPGGVHKGIFDTHPLAVKYTGTDWAIFHEDGSPIPAGASYNVYVVNESAYPMFYTHTATTSNSTANATLLDNWLLDGDPFHILIVTQNYTVNGVNNGTANKHNIGVVYVNSHWAIFNQDGAPIPAGASFNVWVVR
jgi:hypothetical protein